MVLSNALHGILLRKIFLANDDVILDVFTYEQGRISVFASKLARSKKKTLEIDFFRLLEIIVDTGRTGNFKLRAVTTDRFYSVFTSNYEVMNHGFGVLGRLPKILPEEKPMPNFFSFLLKIFETWDPHFSQEFFCFFRIKCLQTLGILPHFNDITDKSIYLHPQTLEDSPKFLPEFILVSIKSQQLMKYLRNSLLMDFLEKKEDLENFDFASVDKIISEIEKYH